MRSKIFALITLLAIILVGGRSAHAKSTGVQDIYVEMKVQGPVTSGCVNFRQVPYEIWFTIVANGIRGGSHYQSGTTDSCGYIFIGDAPAGQDLYYYVKGPRWLAGGAIYHAKVCGYDCTTYVADPDVDYAGDSFGNDICGWPYGDNIVTITDFNSMKASFGFLCGDPSYNSRDDFNNNCVVNVSDLNLLKVNYGRTGYVCAFCLCSTPVWKPNQAIDKTDREKMDLVWRTTAERVDIDSK